MIFSDFSDFPIVGNKRNWKMKKKNENEYVYFFWVFPVPGTNNKY